MNHGTRPVPMESRHLPARDGFRIQSTTGERSVNGGAHLSADPCLSPVVDALYDEIYEGVAPKGWGR